MQFSNSKDNYIINFVHYMQKSSKIWLDAPEWALLLDFKIWKFSFLISKHNYTTECLEFPLYV